MLFYNFFVTKIDKVIEVTLRNDLKFKGKLVSVTPFLNFTLKNVELSDNDKNTGAGLMNLNFCVIRGSSVKFVKIEKEENDLIRLQYASRFRAIKGEKIKEDEELINN